MIPAESLSPSSACIIDGMSAIQKMHSENCTFAELSGQVFAHVGKAGCEKERIDFIFDVYKDVSIKSAEMMQRGCNDGVVLANTMPGHRIKQWKCLLVCTKPNWCSSWWKLEEATSWKSRKARYYM